MADETKSVITKNGKSIQINLDKIWTLYGIISVCVTTIVIVVVWFIGNENFKTESRTDINNLREVTLINQTMLIEIGFNVRKDTTFRNWKTYEEIRTMLNLTNIK